MNTATLNSADLEPSFVDWLIQDHQRQTRPRLRWLWEYYRNPLTREAVAGGHKPYRLAQQQGLPARLRAGGISGRLSANVTAKETVIENDIGWRIHTLVDFMFGKPITLQSCAPDPARADLLESFLRKVIERSGGAGFYQDLALLGAVYGFVDVLVNSSELPGKLPGGGAQDADRAAEHFVLELIEAPRAIPVLSPSDYRRLDAYILHYDLILNEIERPGFVTRVRDRVLGRNAPASGRASVERCVIWTEGEMDAFTIQDGRRVHEEWSLNRLGRVPIVHIQNLPQPFFYEGLSEVEPLIPLQDELNTRLSDRANRVTFQSFKMYLGKGIERFVEQPIGPGQMWATDNPAASIEEFGGDAASPSEDAHINEIRGALDKTSGVSPVAAGIVRDKVGNLTSENALRIVMMGLLAKTEKKRQTYGAGIARMCELILHAADVLGVLPNEPRERGVRIDWPSAIPENQTQRLQEAEMKLRLGVPRKQILAELGYSESTP